jgi:hypothetical protein
MPWPGKREACLWFVRGLRSLSSSEGFDVKGIEGLVMASPHMNTEQVIGRLREKPEAEKCWWWEQNCLEIPWSLRQLVIEYTGIVTRRYVVDIVDPFSIFHGMSYNRAKTYRKLNCKTHLTTVKIGQNVNF